MFRDTVSYRQSNSDAHRVRSTNIRPPAMTWHMAFWLPEIIKEDKVIYETFADSENRKTIQERLDTILLRIAKGLRYANDDHHIKIKPTVGNVSVLFASYVDSATLEPMGDDFDKDDDKYILRDIKNNDRRVITLEFRWKDYFTTIRCELQTEYFTITVIVEAVHDAYKKRNSHDAVKFFSDILIDQKSEEIRLERLYDLFWSDFKSFIYSLDGVKSSLMDKDLLGEIFADFRGFVTNDRAPVVHENACKTTEWAINSINRYRSDISNKKEEDLSSRAYECSASYMLDKNVIYMTALGPQDPSRRLRTRNPVTFIVFVRNDPSSGKPNVNRWQLGRLVDRINLMGRVRLAALRNLKLLRLVSVELSRIDRFVSAAQEAIQNFGNKHENDVKNNKAIEDARKKLNDISRRFITDCENTSHSGISYRVERSRYYVNIFRNNVPRMRLERIEGYQPYDHFVEKRQGSSFDSIDRIGIRYERAMRAIATIEQNYLSVLSHKTNEDVRHIQRWGELFLIFFLIPYYLLGIYKYLVEFRLEYEQAMIIAGYVIVGITFTVGLGVYFRSAEKSWKKFIVPCIGIILMFLLILSALFQAKKPKAKDDPVGGYSKQIYPKNQTSP